MTKLRNALAIMFGLSVMSCTGAPMMKMDVSDYREAFAYTNDEQILVSILRAKDGAPLHFTELATLGANMQLTSSLQATMPFGELYGATTRATSQGILGAQNNPNLSLSSLETQNFTQGLLSPVKPTLLKQFFDEGIDQRLLLLLFFSGFQEGGKPYLNNLKCDRTEPRCYDHFYDYLKKVNALAEQKLIPNIYVELTPVGKSMPWPSGTALKDLAGIDTAKYRVETSADGTNVTVYSVSEPKFELCTERTDTKTRTVRLMSIFAGPSPQQSCGPVRYINPNQPSDPKKSKGLAVRSVYQIIEYLGQVVELEEREGHGNRCIKLGAENRDYSCNAEDVLFQVNAPLGTPLVTTSYRGTPYTVSVGPCDPISYCDHSAEVLKVVSLLINVNKSATDIPQVPLVHVTQ